MDFRFVGISVDQFIKIEEFAKENNMFVKSAMVAGKEFHVIFTMDTDNIRKEIDKNEC